MKNFKSYENQIVNNFSPHINVIIGRNGEGKSNFFKGTFLLNQLLILSSLIESLSIRQNITLIVM